MKLVINSSRNIHLTAANGVGGQRVGKLREGVDLAAAEAECRRVNREVIEPLRGSHAAAEARRSAAREALADLID